MDLELFSDLDCDFEHVVSIRNHTFCWKDSYIKEGRGIFNVHIDKDLKRIVTKVMTSIEFDSNSVALCKLNFPLITEGELKDKGKFNISSS